ncbi:MAG: PQQ-binding-like beta-propeller repeat protein [Planctomycetota bacterium]
MFAAALILATCAVGSADAPAQEPPLPATAGEDSPDGPVVHMLESPNIDRFLRRAQEFLARSEWEQAITVLQDVVDGRTLAEELPTTPTPSESPTDSAPTAPDETSENWGEIGESASMMVFSQDQRLFRPVQRLCQDLLASLPAEGVAAYRARFEIDAERQLAQARESGRIDAFRAVHDRYFLTKAGGTALREAADRQLDSGRFRQAHRSYRDLLEVYPEALRRDLGLDDLWLRVRALICLSLMGERSSAAASIAELVEHHPDDSIRIAGELIPVREIANSPIFQTAARVPSARRSDDELRLSGPEDTLLPFFEYRYEDGDPYRAGKISNQDHVIFLQSTSGIAGLPKVTELRPGTSVTFAGTEPGITNEVFFLDHYRLTKVEVPSGRILAMANTNNSLDELRVQDPRAGHARSRIPVYDQVLLRATVAEDRVFTITGVGAERASGVSPILRTVLRCYARDDLRLLWSTVDEPLLDSATFLAAATIADGKLYVPALVGGTFWLACLSAADGSIHFRTPIHRGGTLLAKPPAVPAVVDGGIAFVSTNAGTVAAIDAVSGGVRWIRRYERTDPLRPKRIERNRRLDVGVFGGSILHEVALSGFAPTDLLLRDGLLVIAPTDGDQLLCLDTATGEVAWRFERDRFRVILGMTDDTLVLASSTEIMAVDIRGGLRRWQRNVPGTRTDGEWSGRGTMIGNLVVLPTEQGLSVTPLSPDATWTTLRLPPLRVGHDRLRGAFNVFRAGPWLAAVYAGGFEVYSSRSALASLLAATVDPGERASLLAQAGDLSAAVEVYESMVGTQPVTLPDPHGARMLSLCSEIALAQASRGLREQAITTLDRARKFVEAPGLLMRWHLARIEIFEAIEDMDAVANEQRALYRVMETGG